MARTSQLTQYEREEKWKQIQELAGKIIELNGGHDIELTTPQRRVDKWYKGWQGTMKPSY